MVNLQNASRVEKDRKTKNLLGICSHILICFKIATLITFITLRLSLIDRLLTEFTRSLPEILSEVSPNGSDLTSISKSLREHIISLKTASVRIPKEKRAEADTLATDAWNAATTVRRSIRNASLAPFANPDVTTATELTTLKGLSTSVRLLSFLLLHAVAIGAGKTSSESLDVSKKGIRVVKAGIKAAKGNIEIGDIEGAFWALEAIALWGPMEKLGRALKM